MDSFTPLDCSSSVINHEEEDNDDWVVVKKQKIIILIPPSSPTIQQIAKEMSPKSVKTALKKRSSSDQFDRKPKPQPPESSFRAYGIGNVGAAKAANRRIRAANLERKLRSLGGMRRWLSSIGLDRFAKFFESKKVGQCELVNLSTTKLKEMGMNAVGPRRKLIHAIDLLCQPYYSHGF